MDNEGKLLIVDDDKDVLQSLELFLKYEFELVETLKNPNLIPGLLKQKEFDVILLDMNFSAGINTGNEGIYWLREILKIDKNIAVVPITAYGDISLAVQAIKEGAVDFVVKPWDNDKLLSTLKAGLTLKRTRQEVQQLKDQQQQLFRHLDRRYVLFRGTSPVMEEVYKDIDKVAPTDANILITGENGTGKEMLAREIHRKSSRRDSAFIQVDLGAIHENLFESELFGHIKGAFTDAGEDRTGRFELANHGTLFLDEINNLPLHLQTKLLSVIETQAITRVGSNSPQPLDLRIICATNKNLGMLVQENLFREDLLFRINTVEIHVPALRQRGDDMLILAGEFLKEFGQKYEKPELKINARAQEKLIRYDWPGNVRELRHTLEKAVIMAESGTLGPEDFHFPVRHIKESGVDETTTLSSLEKTAIEKSLLRNKGNITVAAEELGISRPTLYHKINKYQIRL